jgi:multidrug efflux pump subunit AcrB
MHLSANPMPLDSETAIVMSILILFAGIGGYIVMSKDILPEICVMTIVWTYIGPDTPGMEKRVTTYT